MKHPYYTAVAAARFFSMRRATRALEWLAVLLLPAATLYLFLYVLSTHINNGSNGGGSTISIAIVLVLKNPSAAGGYELAMATQRCYAAVQNYSYNILFLEHHNSSSGNDDDDGEIRTDATGQQQLQPAVESEWEAGMIDKCLGERLAEEHTLNSYQGNFMFDRHCAVAEFMASHPEHDYILFVDSDMGVINPERRIEEFIDTEADLTFSVRGLEIAASSYLAKNSEYSRRFLMNWYNFSWELAARTGTTFDRPGWLNPWNLDNGALHSILMGLFASDEEIEECDKLFMGLRHYGLYLEDYDAFVACTRHHLSNHHDVRGLLKPPPHRNYSTNDDGGSGGKGGGGRVRVQPVTNSLYRDGSTRFVDVWSSDHDFMLHGWKTKYSSFHGRVDIPPADQVDGPSAGYWRNPLVGAPPFPATTVECASRPPAEVVRRFWKERWRSDLMVSREALDTLLEEHTRQIGNTIEAAYAKIHPPSASSN